MNTIKLHTQLNQKINFAKPSTLFYFMINHAIFFTTCAKRMRLVVANIWVHKSTMALLCGVFIPIASIEAGTVDSAGKTLLASLVWTGQTSSEQKDGGCVAFRRRFQ